MVKFRKIMHFIPYIGLAWGLWDILGWVGIQYARAQGEPAHIPESNIWAYYENSPGINLISAIIQGTSLLYIQYHHAAL